MNPKQNPVFQSRQQFAATRFQGRAGRMHARTGRNLTVEITVLRKDFVAGVSGGGVEIIGQHGRILRMESSGIETKAERRSETAATEGDHERTRPESSRYSTAGAALPCSHVIDQNHTPVSPIQNSAGVNESLEPSGRDDVSGMYSACQPKASPCHAMPAAWRRFTNARTSSKAGTTIGRSDSWPSAILILARTVATLSLRGSPSGENLVAMFLEDALNVVQFV